MTNILYKYKSLENFNQFVDIILENRLFASKYKDMNDPMEGVYYYSKGDFDRQLLEKLADEKSNLRICSLSKKNNNELMWSHYSNGHRGVNIGVRINSEKYEVKPIIYNGNPFIQNQNYSSFNAMEILSYKNQDWYYENEVRVFVKDFEFIEVEIVEIITGLSISITDYNLIEKLLVKVNPKIRIIKAETIMN